MRHMAVHEAIARTQDFLDSNGLVPFEASYTSVEGAVAQLLFRDFIDGLTFKFSSGVWADEADVSVRYNGGDPRVTINWSSTHRTIEEAKSALANYQKAVHVASLMDSFLSQIHITPAETEA